jgi:L-2,4-diaminobutyrate decarboxylase
MDYNQNFQLKIRMSKSNSKIPKPFDPEEFRTNGHNIVDILADYLENALSGKEMAVLPWHHPDQLTEMFSFSSGGGESEPVNSWVKRIIESSNHLHHPHYIGHQVTSPLPLTAIVQFCTTLLNNGAAIYEMGPASMAMEKNIINLFGSLIGFKKGFDGIFTHGGTAGNLTAMLAARQAKTNYNIWEEGVSDDNRPGFMISTQAHYSIGRNVKIMGLGNGSIIKVPTGPGYRIRTDMLGQLKRDAEKRGINVISVVASACSTATGSYDNLMAIADFCEENNLWMHVDGAHGMGVLFSDKYRDLVKGVERADSIVIDFHKMLLVPALNTLIMFKNGERSYETFAQKASYLFKQSQKPAWYDSAIRTIECTKSSLGIIAYTALKYYRNGYYKEYIDSRYDLASTFAGIIKSETRLQLAAEPESNIVCFRYAPAGADDEHLNEINSAIRDRIMKDGSFYIVQTELDGKIWLRVTIINPVTSEEDLRNLVFKIEETAKNIDQQGRVT